MEDAIGEVVEAVAAGPVVESTETDLLELAAGPGARNRE